MSISESFHEYFAALDRSGGEDRCYLCRRTGADVKLFLVSFFTRSPNELFEPNDLQLLNRGIRFRRMGWDPISPGFGTQRLQQQVPQLAVYGFAPEIDLEIDLVVDYEGVQNAGWPAIISRIREERGRARARAGGR